MLSSDADRLLQCRLRHIVNEVYDPEVTIEVKEIRRNVDEFVEILSCSSIFSFYWVRNK